MKNLYSIFITSIAGLATILGNILLFINVKHKEFLISLIELLPEGIKLVYQDFNLSSIFMFSLLLLFIGYFIVILIDKNIDSDNALYKVGILSMVSLLIHNIPEGIICAISSTTNIELGLKMSFVILVHNIPEGICICLPIYYATKSKLKAFLYTLVSGVGEIIGAIFTMIFLKNAINNYSLYIILIITAGIMITLSIKKILKEGLSFKKYSYFALGILLGIIILYFTL